MMKLLAKISIDYNIWKDALKVVQGILFKGHSVTDLFIWLYKPSLRVMTTHFAEISVRC